MYDNNVYIRENHDDMRMELRDANCDGRFGVSRFASDGVWCRRGITRYRVAQTLDHALDSVYSVCVRNRRQFDSSLGRSSVRVCRLAGPALHRAVGGRA